jgi:hypothetical protein
MSATDGGDDEVRIRQIGLSDSIHAGVEELDPA